MFKLINEELIYSSAMLALMVFSFYSEQLVVLPSELSSFGLSKISNGFWDFSTRSFPSLGKKFGMFCSFLNLFKISVFSEINFYWSCNTSTFLFTLLYRSVEVILLLMKLNPALAHGLATLLFTQFIGVIK